MSRRAIRLALALACALAAAQAGAAQSTGGSTGAVGGTSLFGQKAGLGQIVNSQDTAQMGRAALRGLDTLNGISETLSVAVGETLRFGQLEITLEACRVPREAPESDAYAFLRIRDLRETEPRFAGWMFASSPALSALDHPRYDVWVLSCSNS